jgi:hypothetical protein
MADIENSLPSVGTKRSGEVETEDDSTTNNEEITNINDSESGNVEDNDDPSKKTPWYRSIKLLIGILLLGFIIFVIADSATNGYVRDAVGSFLDWIENNPIAGFFLFVVGK